MKQHITRRALLLATVSTTACVLFKPYAARATVSADQAAQLKTTLTPFGAVKAGNADGSYPAWDSGYTEVPAGFVSGGRMPNIFPDEQPLLTITASNASQYADKLTEGTKALLAKYGDFFVSVYPSHRTAAAPQWVYDNIFENATRASLVQGPAGSMPSGAYGGPPFPIPQSAEEVVWNHNLAWQATSFYNITSAYILSSAGGWTLTSVSKINTQYPYMFPDSNEQAFAASDGTYLEIATNSIAPPLNNGNALVGTGNLDDSKSANYVYLPGEGRVREVPNPCCDVLTPFSSGDVFFDEISVWAGRLNHFTWSMAGTKEMYLPYNCNMINQPSSDAEVLGVHTVNSKYVRFELRRVRVVDAVLKDGFIHPCVKSRYYFDEDTGRGLMAERYDAQGRLWRVLFALPFVYAEVPWVSMNIFWGVHDLVADTAYVAGIMNEQSNQGQAMPRFPESLFTPETLSANGDNSE